MNLLQDKLKNIKAELESVIEIVDGLESYNEIPETDIDLMKQKLIKSFEEIVRISCIEKPELHFESTEGNTEEITEEEDFEVKFIETIDDAPEEAKEYYEKVIEEREKEEINIEDKGTEIKEPEIKKEEINTETEQKTEQKELNIGENNDSALTSIFKSFENTNDIAAKLQFKSISDIKTAISINDRVGYISEIFSGNLENFNSCLENINNAPNINVVIDELKDKIEWDGENPIHKSFLELVYRKFI